MYLKLFRFLHTAAGLEIKFPRVFCILQVKKINKNPIFFLIRVHNEKSFIETRDVV